MSVRIEVMKYYISDLHFFHRNVNGLDDRGFETMFDMHENMVRIWNERVTDNDEVYILGDLSFGRGIETWELLNKLKGKLILVEGNHDFHFLDDKEFVDNVFDEIVSYAEITDSRRKVILSHYPMMIYNHQFKVDESGNPMSFMLYGHVHNTYDEYLINRFINETSRLEREHSRGKYGPTPVNMINTFCMFSNYVPLTLDEWIALDSKRRKLINDFEAEHGGTLDYDLWKDLSTVINERSKTGWAG